METKKPLSRMFFLGIFVFIVCICVFASCADKHELYSGVWEAEENRGVYASSPMGFFHNGLLFFYPEQRQTGQTSGIRVMMVCDIKTGAVFPLCGKPDCLHSVDECNAVLEGNSFTRRFYVCGERVFWIRRSNETVDGAQGHFLYSAKLDGSEHKQETELDHELELSLSTGLMCIYNGRLFRFALSTKVENGRPVVTTILYDQEISGNSRPRILLVLDQPSTVMLKISEGILYAAAFDQTALDLKLYALNTESDELNMLFSGEPPSSACDMFVAANGDIVFSFPQTVFSYSLATHSFRELYFNETIATDEVFFEMLPGNEFICTNWNGELLCEGEMKADGFDPNAFMKRYIGFYDGKLYFCCNDMDNKNDWYILAFDPEDGSFAVLCSGTGNTAKSSSQQSYNMLKTEIRSI